jgi:hypothetical protein
MEQSRGEYRPRDTGQRTNEGPSVEEREGAREARLAEWFQQPFVKQAIVAQERANVILGDTVRFLEAKRMPMRPLRDVFACGYDDEAWVLQEEEAHNSMHQRNAWDWTEWTHHTPALLLFPDEKLRIRYVPEANNTSMSSRRYPEHFPQEFPELRWAPHDDSDQYQSDRFGNYQWMDHPWWEDINGHNPWPRHGYFVCASVRKSHCEKCPVGTPELAFQVRTAGPHATLLSDVVTRSLMSLRVI